MQRYAFLQIVRNLKIMALVFAFFAIIAGCSSDDGASSNNNDTGCGMSFTLNGTKWCGTSYYTLVNLHSLTISGVVSGKGTASISIDNYSGTGTYPTHVAASYTDATTQEIYIESSSSLVITKAEGNTMEGTFSFTVVSTSDSTHKITVTDGKFSSTKLN